MEAFIIRTLCIIIICSNRPTFNFQWYLLIYIKTKKNARICLICFLKYFIFCHRYNELRRLIHLDPIATFDDLTTNSVHVAELREVYNDDVEQLDFLVGSLAESPLPSVFGFSDTFFRIFVLMARRRIMADRFYTDDYTAEFYTQWGLDYIDETWMKPILLRHYPDLASNLQYVNNVFIPWQYQTPPSKWYKNWLSHIRRSVRLYLHLFL